jgi:hypothetical protein
MPKGNNLLMSSMLLYVALVAMISTCLAHEHLAKGMCVCIICKHGCMDKLVYGRMGVVLQRMVTWRVVSACLAHEHLAKGMREEGVSLCINVW